MWQPQVFSNSFYIVTKDGLLSHSCAGHELLFVKTTNFRSVSLRTTWGKINQSFLIPEVSLQRASDWLFPLNDVRDTYFDIANPVSMSSETSAGKESDECLSLSWVWRAWSEFLLYLNQSARINYNMEMKLTDSFFINSLLLNLVGH